LSLIKVGSTNQFTPYYITVHFIYFFIIKRDGPNTNLVINLNFKVYNSIIYKNSNIVIKNFINGDWFSPLIDFAILIIRKIRLFHE